MVEGGAARVAWGGGVAALLRWEGGESEGGGRDQRKTPSEDGARGKQACCSVA